MEMRRLVICQDRLNDFIVETKKGCVEIHAPFFFRKEIEMTIQIEKVNIQTLDPNYWLQTWDRLIFKWGNYQHSAICCYLHLIGEQSPNDIIQVCLFEDCVAERIMDSDSKITDFQESELYEWLHTDFLNGFEKDMLDRIADITIPSVSDIFYKSEDPLVYSLFYPDKRINREPLDIMQNPRNKISFFNYEKCPYWLKDNYKSKNTLTYFGIGDLTLQSAVPNMIRGVRPILILRQV